MRFSTIIATLVVLLSPLFALAQTQTSTNTALSTSTITLTKTVHQATATSTLAKSKSFSTTSSNSSTAVVTPASPTTASLGSGFLGAQGTGAVTPTTASAHKGNSLGNSASVEKCNLVIVGLAGVAAIVLGSSL